MKRFNKQILEAINRGIQLALDDFEDNEPNSSLSQQSDVIDSEDIIKYRADLMQEVIDMGLPSKTLWCKYNLEAYPELDLNPCACDFYGNYYSWGETTVKNDYSIDTLTFYDSNRNLTKYCEKDNLTELLPEDDVAYQNKKLHNFKFHIPTKEQCEELLKYSTYQWVKIDKQYAKYLKFNISSMTTGLNGVLFISKINGNKLFFPAAGYKTGEKIEDKKIEGGIWSSTNAFGKNDNIYNYHKAYFLHFDGSFDTPAYIDIDYRGRGINIRPVLEKGVN